MFDRNPAPGQKAILLVRTPVDGIVQKICSNPAVIQKRVSLGRRTVSDNSFPFILETDQGLQQIAFHFLNLLAESRVIINPSIPFADLSRLQFRHTGGEGFAPII